ncbi:hypothetical protein Tco_1009469, partial [Tanacetum coccineum]
MIEANKLLAERLQSKEREELTDEEKAKLFMELIEKRRKHFAAIGAQEKRNRPPTKAQKRTQMATYLKHMVDEVELKKLLVIKKDEDIAIDAIPLATKLPVIVDYKLHKEGMLVHYQLIRVDGSSKRYSSMIRMLQGIDREDLEALWRIVKAKYGDTRPENEFKRVLYGDLKVMFEPDIKSDMWRMLQGYRVTIWKLIDSSGVYFLRFDNLHIFMLVERRYPLTPITITNMLNKKLQSDHQNKMCYQLLKLMIQKMNIKFRGGLLGLKRLHGFLEVTAAQVRNRSRFGINKWYQSFALRNFDLEDMELESTNSGPTAKLPILKLGEYEMWAIRIKQYFQIQDYALWEVIENGDSWVSISQTTEENGKTIGDYDWSDQVEEGPTNFALMAYSSTSSNSEVSTDSNFSSSCLEHVKFLKEQNEQLLKDLRGSKINAITYKTGLKSVEARLLVYKKNESVYEEDIKVLKCEIHLKEVAIIELRRKLDQAQKQIDEIQLTVENFENSSKNLSKLLDCQIVDKCKTEEFVNEPIVSEPTIKKPVVETNVAKASEEKPKMVRKSNGAPIIEDWVS